MEVHRADSSESALYKDGSDARQPGLSLHLQLLHRFGRTVSALDFDVMKEDLRFLLRKFKRPLVGWHDPNFGVRFNEMHGCDRGCRAAGQY